MASPFYVRVEVADRPGVLALVALRLAAQEISVARLVQRPGDGERDAAHRHPRGARGTAARCARRDRRARRDPRACLGARGDLGPRRGGARMALVTLGEGNTPLLPAPRLSERLGCELWLKCEGANPTGSFKDRGMTVAVSRALERGAPGVVCASTGNTAASAAAYAARAGLPAVIVIPKGAVARGKLAQVLAAGADLREVRGHVRGGARARPSPGRRGGLGERELDQPGPDRRAGVGRPRDRRTARRPARRARAPVRGRREHARVRPRVRRGRRRQAASALGAVGQAPETVATAIRISQPVHREQAEAIAEVVTVADGRCSSGGARSAGSKGSSASRLRPPGSPASRSPPRGARRLRADRSRLKDPDAAERL